uniref:Uncharacterized protein n=1 Tax=Myoviridae sp. ctPuP5 TaxID=2823543 RepID=A0A8S5L9C0_9CAUD|nr:MAG TPA: hypothetical protein [Myoviridae sp. ctPuP5]
MWFENNYLSLQSVLKTNSSLTCWKPKNIIFKD